MVTTWVTGAAILAHARVTAPTADETDWAATCAGAVNAALEAVLDWGVVAMPLQDVQVSRSGNAGQGFVAWADTSGVILSQAGGQYEPDRALIRFVRDPALTDADIRAAGSFEARSPAVGAFLVQGFRLGPSQAADAILATEQYLVEPSGSDWLILEANPATGPSPEAGAELTAVALIAGAEAFARRSAPFGVTSYQDLQGIAVRVARDYVEGIRPQLQRWRDVTRTIG